MGINGHGAYSYGQLGGQFGGLGGKLPVLICPS
jgi:hypothetical protein